MNRRSFPRLVTSGPASGPCLVLGNALGTDTRLWSDLERSLAPSVRIVRFDYPGHGGAGDAAYASIQDLADALLEALEAGGIRHFFYCGISMGGAVGMALALAAPRRLLGLVLSNTAAQFGAADFWSQRIAQAEREGVESLAPAAVARWLTAERARRDPVTAARLRAMFCATSVPGYTQACRAIQAFDARERLRAIEVPTLVIAGSHDVATSPAQAQELHRAIRKSRYLAVPAAHLANIGCPEDLNWAVDHFITSLAKT